MKTFEGLFTNYREYTKMLGLLSRWKDDSQNVRGAFIKLIDTLMRKPKTRFSFKSRPGVSHSLRASVRFGDAPGNHLYALVDIIDDNPENRWLSVCFYSGTVNDADELGNLIPKGILGVDGYCFDVTEDDEILISYLRQRINEAYEKILAS